MAQINVSNLKFSYDNNTEKRIEREIEEKEGLLVDLEQRVDAKLLPVW